MVNQSFGLIRRMDNKGDKMIKEKEQYYMCVNCGGQFPRDEMCFDTEYDCDFCDDCMPKDEEEK